MEAYGQACAERKVKPNAALIEQELSNPHLDLRRNYVGTEEGFAAFLSWLKSAEHIQSVDLSDCMLTTDNVKDLCELCLVHPSIAHLTLRSNRLFVESGNHLLRLARFNANMRRIDVRDDGGDGVLSAHANHIPERILRKIDAHLAYNQRIHCTDQVQ
uniref:Uncharacterized protein n=1 Tax=Neobodo designis TaxID=312471 RepID=A0A7S1PM08_NEODS|mmetsp:Transcript_10370/g.32123  ORF Transcript_10370/g.32123 Transcript_10370/m.32123 type:complete len:158 (+) Transcript_10370:26-499(+)